MSEPTPPVPAPHDPLTSVLLIVTEIRGDVKSALARIDKHETRLDKVETRVDEYGNRLTALEAVDQRDTQHDQRHTSSRAVFWTAVGAVVACIALAVTLVLVVAGHGG